MAKKDIYSAAGLMAYIQEVGFLPLLSTPEESYRQLTEHFRKILPEATDKQIQKLIG